MSYSYKFVINNGVLEKYLYKNKVKVLQIPNGVKTIGDYAFLCCETVRVIILPESVEHIGTKAFCRCTSLEGIHIHGSLKSAGADAFDGCTALKWVNISDLAAWSSAVFENREANPLNTAAGLFVDTVPVENPVIPEGVEAIGDYAFCQCDRIKSVTLPSSVKSIGKCAFYGCSCLEAVNIPDGVTAIGADAFCYCSALRSVNIPDSVRVLGDNAFEHCLNLRCLTVPETVKELGNSIFNGLVYFKGRAFDDLLPENRHAGSLIAFAMNYENDTVPESVIQSYADFFRYEKYRIGFKALIEYPELLKFAVRCMDTVLTRDDAKALLSLIPENLFAESRVMLIDYINKHDARTDDFDSFDRMLDEGYTPIEQLVREWRFFENRSGGITLFKYIGSGENIICPAEINGKTVNVLNEYVFAGLQNIKSVFVSDGVVIIGQRAFRDCTALESVRLPAALRSISYNAFGGCNSLRFVSIGSIAAWCVVEMHSFINNLPGFRHTLSVDGVPAEDIVIPDGVPHVASYAFQNCENLRSVTVPGNVEEIGEYSFSECPGLKTVVLHEGIKRIGAFAFSECEALENINIPDSVEEIHSTAFLCCTALSEETQRKINEIIGGKHRRNVFLREET